MASKQHISNPASDRNLGECPPAQPSSKETAPSLNNGKPRISEGGKGAGDKPSPQADGDPRALNDRTNRPQRTGGTESP
jgi:hypothetical protein